MGCHRATDIDPINRIDRPLNGGIAAGTNRNQVLKLSRNGGTAGIKGMELTIVDVGIGAIGDFITKQC